MKNKKKAIKITDESICSCGCKKKEHYLGEGFCKECGCTWFSLGSNDYETKTEKSKR